LGIVSNLTSAEMRTAFSVAATWHDARTVTELASVVTASLHELVPCDGAGWNEVDLGGHEVRAVTSPVGYFDAGGVATLNRLIDQHPIVQYVARTGDTSATKLSDFASARQLHALEIYTDFFRPLGIEDLLAVIVRVEPVIIGVAFTRPRRSYRERDRELLNLLRPHLAAAYEHVAARELVARTLDGRFFVRLTAGGRIAETSALLEEWFGTMPRTLSPGIYSREGADLHVRQVDADPPVLLLEIRRYAVDRRRVRDLGLTAREAEIVELAARGLTDAEIAGELSLSARTIAKHLEHAYVKLGVHSRREAATLLLSAS
jgi:DNA-binding CsgD family transcriptional regulator